MTFALRTHNRLRPAADPMTSQQALHADAHSLSVNARICAGAFVVCGSSAFLGSMVSGVTTMSMVFIMLSIAMMVMAFGFARQASDIWQELLGGGYRPPIVMSDKDIEAAVQSIHQGCDYLTGESL